MKILCPEHNGMIEVPSKDIADTFKSPLNSLIFRCPVCQDEVLIKNIRLEQEVILSNVNRSRKEQQNAKGA